MIDEIGEMDASYLEDFSFDYFGFLPDEVLSCCDENVGEDQIRNLGMALRFLKIFSKCITRDKNLKVSWNHAIAAHLGLSSPPKEQLLCPVQQLFEQITELEEPMFLVLQIFEQIRSKVTYFYDLISVSSQSYIPMTSDLVVELITDLMQNLKDLLSSKADWMVTIKSQISFLNERLQFFRNFLDFLAKGCCKHEKFKDLLAHSEALAIDAARISYSCLADQRTEESTLEIKLKLSELLEKIKPLKAEDKEMYIGVLAAAKSSESSDGCMKDELVLGAFLDSLHELLLEILEPGSRLKLPVHDQLKPLDEEFKFRVLLVDPPRQNTGSENWNDLFRSIEALIIDLGTLTFTLYIDEMTEDLAMQMNLVLANLLEKMKGIKLKGREIYLNASKPSRSRFPKTDGLGFIKLFLESLRELLTHRDNSVPILKQ